MKTLSWRPLGISLVICALFTGFSALAKKDAPVDTDIFRTLPNDGVRYQWDGVKRIVSIGDIHGDFNALVQDLIHADLMDAQGNWIAKPGTHVVLLGDYIDGGNDGAMVYNLLRVLEVKARNAGSYVHVLPGNHDVLAASGQSPHITAVEMSEFIMEEGGEEGDIDEAHALVDKGIRDSIRSNPDLAKWLAGLNTTVELKMEGDDLPYAFVHGGFNPNELGRTRGLLGRINATVRAYINAWLLDGPLPPKTSNGIVGMDADGNFAHGNGPLFTRIFKFLETKYGARSNERPDGAPKPKVLAEYFRNVLRIKKLVVGHAPTKDGLISPHAFYGALVWVVDIAQSLGFGDKGNIGYLDIRRVHSEVDKRRIIIREAPTVMIREKHPSPALYDQYSKLTEKDVRGLIASVPTCNDVVRQAN